MPRKTEMDVLKEFRRRVRLSGRLALLWMLLAAAACAYGISLGHAGRADQAMLWEALAGLGVAVAVMFGIVRSVNSDRLRASRADLAIMRGAPTEPPTKSR